MKLNVIGVPLNLGCDRDGADKAPDRLREAGLIETIRKHGHRVFDLGNLYIPKVKQQDKFAKGKSVKYLDAIVEVNNNLAELVRATICGGAFPLVIGGDHSLGLGSVSGVSEFYDDFGIIWLDAHGDINTSDTSPSGNIHGMALAALMGVGNDELINIYSPRTKVNPANVFLVGTRDLDKGEQELIRKHNLNVYSMDVIRKEGITYVAEDIKRKLRERKIRNVHCSIDIDIIDPKYAPGTGTTVADGVMPGEFKTFLDKILSANLIKSIDMVELNPLLDKNDMTTKLCLEIIDYIADRL